MKWKTHHYVLTLNFSFFLRQLFTFQFQTAKLNLYSSGTKSQLATQNCVQFCHLTIIWLVMISVCKHGCSPLISERLRLIDSSNICVEDIFKIEWEIFSNLQSLYWS